MNREIKFRMWDKKDKKMRKVESIGFGELSYENYLVVNGAVFGTTYHIVQFQANLKKYWRRNNE